MYQGGNKINLMFKKLQQELEIIYQNTGQYVQQLKERIIGMIKAKLEEFENELMREIQRELAYFTQISEIQDVQESFDSFKEQIRNKLNQLKDLEVGFENIKLNGKINCVNPQLFIKQQPEMILQGQIKLESQDKCPKFRRNKLITYLCPVCQMKIKSSQAARAHLNSMHGIKKGLSCPHCELLYNRSTTLAQHIFTTHTKSLDRKYIMNTYECTFTGKLFRKKTDLQYHIAQEVGYLIMLSNIKPIVKQNSQESSRGSVD